MRIAVFTLTSPLHNEEAVHAVTAEFLNSLKLMPSLQGNDFSSYGQHDLNLIYVRTGGTEGLFRQLLPQLLHQSDRPFYLLTSGKSNSLAASLEILSYLRQKGLRGEVLHGSTAYVTERIAQLEKVEHAGKTMRGMRLGIVGQPSDWLIASEVDSCVVREKLGIELVEIPIDELLEIMQQQPESTSDLTSDVACIREALPGAQRIYAGLKELVRRYRLNGLTLRCFDLLTAVRNTGCLALAKLASEGIVASCEGDVPAMLTMAIGQTLTGIVGFQANPSRIDVESGRMLFAHCTIPLNMVERYELDTHFESGIGVGIRGYMKEGPVTVCKVSGDLKRHFSEEGMLVENQSQPDLCRTQQLIQLSNPQRATYFLTEPIGNHHVILPGRHKRLFDDFLK